MPRLRHEDDEIGELGTAYDLIFARRLNRRDSGSMRDVAWKIATRESNGKQDDIDLKADAMKG